MKPGAVFYVWFADREGYNFYGAVHDVGWVLSEKLVWVKNSLILGRFDYQMRHEPACTAGKKVRICGPPIVSRLPSLKWTDLYATTYIQQ